MLNACLAALSAASLPLIPTCAGTQQNKIYISSGPNPIFYIISGGFMKVSVVSIIKNAQAIVYDEVFYGLSTGVRVRTSPKRAMSIKVTKY